MNAQRQARRGLTLVELVLAIGLAALVIVALGRLLQTSLSLWGRTEARRDLEEGLSGVSELLARDLSQIEAGPRGDLLVEWHPVDLDGDGIPNLPCLRIALVRNAAGAELERLRTPVPGELFQPDPRLQQSALVEVCWQLVFQPRETTDLGFESAPIPLGRLVRGERALWGDSSPSFFEPQSREASLRNLPPNFASVGEGILWVELLCAAPPTRLEDGWSLGRAMTDAASAWDARGLGRPELESGELNRLHPWMSGARPVFAGLDQEPAPLLPRRLCIALELERPQDWKRRTSLREGLGLEQGQLLVLDGRRLPAAGGFVLIDEEWMEVLDVSGDVVGVRRGQRGTRALGHEAGARVRYGMPSQRELTLYGAREEWLR